MSKFFVLVLPSVAACTCICQTPATPTAIDVSEQVDAGVMVAVNDAGDAGDDSLCRLSCARMLALGCAEGKPVPTGDTCYLDRDCHNGTTCDIGAKTCVESCEKFCNDTMGLGIGLNTSCLQQIKTCDDINMCVQG